MPTETGTASASANNELSTVTMNKSRIPNARLSTSVVENSVLVKKLTVLACKDGMARTRRKKAINAMKITMVAPEATAIALKIASPRWRD